MRKIMIALLAAASVAVIAPEAASARGFGGGGFHGGGFHGGGFHGGFHGGSFYRGFGPGFGFGYGFGYPYGYGYGYYPYAYEEYDNHCYIERQRIHTRKGIRYRRVEVCE